MSAMIEFFVAMQKQDSQGTSSFINGARLTLVLITSLMKLTTSWMDQLFTDLTNYITHSLQPTPDGAMLAQGDQIQYQTDSLKKDLSTKQLKIGVDAAKGQVDMANGTRQTAFQLVGAISSIISFSTRAISKKI